MTTPPRTEATRRPVPGADASGQRGAHRLPDDGQPHPPDGNRPHPPRVAAVLLTLAALSLVPAWAHALSGAGGPWAADPLRRWYGDAAVLLGALACLYVALTRSGRRLVAGVLSTGLLLSAAGLVCAQALAGDACRLAGYPLVCAALLVPAYRRVPGPAPGARLDGPLSGRLSGRFSSLLDGLLSGLAAAAVLACVSVPVAIDNASGTGFWERARTLGYPVADLVLLCVLVAAGCLRGWRFDLACAVLGTAVAMWLAGDLLGLFDAQHRLADLAGTLVTTGGVGMAAAIGLAPARPADGPGTGPDTGSRGRYAAVGFAAVSLALLVLAGPLHLTGAATGLAGASLALALVRSTLTGRQNRTMPAGGRDEGTGGRDEPVAEPASDPVTGLPNRRRLELDLAAALAAGSESEPHVLVLLDLDGFKAYNDSFGHGAGDLLLSRLGAALAERVGTAGAVYRMGGDEFCVLSPAPPDVWEFAHGCADALTDRGEGFAITAAYGAALLPDERHEPRAALVLADRRMYRDKSSARFRPASQSASVLAAVLRERTAELAERMQKVSQIACAIAAQFDLKGDELEAVRHASALHDIGKIAIPEATLNKPGPLTDEEWRLIRRHTLIGERILAAAPALHRSARVVRWSHERVDGTGYPDGLIGDQIPLASRIVFVANAFDAMTSDRPYAPRLPVAEALAELRRGTGTQFDAAVVDALRRTTVVPGDASAALCPR